MEIKFKKLDDNAVLPSYAKEGDAGLDLTATSLSYDEFGNVVYGTGLAIEIPEGYVGLIFPRSSNSKQDLLLTNSVGVIDSGYRGEILLKFKHTLSEQDVDNSRRSVNLFSPDYYTEGRNYELGDRIGQLVIIPYPKITPVFSEELSNTSRGSGSFGHTGK